MNKYDQLLGLGQVSAEMSEPEKGEGEQRPLPFFGKESRLFLGMSRGLEPCFVGLAFNLLNSSEKFN